MSKKIGRNDPCPCGSQKKYKKCCLLNEEKRRFVSKSLDNIIKAKYEFMSYIDLDYLLKIHMVAFFDVPNLRGHDESFHVFFDWYLLNYDVEKELKPSVVELSYNAPENIKDNLGPKEIVTNLDIFLESPEVVKALTEDEKEIMRKWKYKNPSIYRISEVYQESTPPSLKAVDIFNNSQYLVNLREIFEESKPTGDLKNAIFISTLVETPLENEYIPFGSLYPLPEAAEKDVYELVNEYHEISNQEKSKTSMLIPSKFIPTRCLIAGFFRVLEIFKLKEIENAIKESDWEKEVYKQTAERFFEEILDCELYSTDGIWQAVDTWFQFSSFEKPHIKNPGGAAAALEYFAAKCEKDSHLKNVTKKELADDYETTTATLSKNYNLIKEYYDKYLAGDDIGIEDIPENLDKEEAREIIDDLLGDLDRSTKPAQYYLNLFNK